MIVKTGSKFPIPKLPVYEWGIVFLFCAILFTLATYAFFGKKRALVTSQNLNNHSSIDHREVLPEIKKIYVSIEGEVAKPGTYELVPQATMQEIFALANPLPQADITQFNLKRKLKDGQKIHVYEKQWISIQVSGAVENAGTFRVLSGTRICDLLDQLQLQPEADRAALKKKKKLLKNGDTIKIARKKKPTHRKVVVNRL